ncbi:unnamed protein product [Symbiodinium sp. CCMP2592]|nr:unnamed protein product [Symbiodinium sp. CCMP2592]
MVAELLQSPNSSVLLVRLVQANAPSTLTNYFGRWKHWVEFCQVQSADEWAPKVAFLCDFLLTHCKGLLGSAIAWLKAFRFISTRLEVESFKVALQSEAVRAFGKSVNVVQRRETPSLVGCSVVSAFLSSLGSAGASGMRYTDENHLSIHAVGSLGSRVSRWASIGPRLVQEAVTRTSAARPGFQPDFLVADLGPDERAPVFLAPLSRAAGVVLIRRLLAMCYESYPADQRPDLSLIGVHSAKVTFLSLAKQLLLDEALRGGAPPLPDVAFSLPALEPVASDARSPSVVPRLHDREPLVLDQDSSSDSEDDAPAAPEVESTSAAPAAAWELVSSGDVVSSPQDLGEPEDLAGQIIPLVSSAQLRTQSGMFLFDRVAP